MPTGASFSSAWRSCRNRGWRESRSSNNFAFWKQAIRSSSAWSTSRPSASTRPRITACSSSGRSGNDSQEHKGTGRWRTSYLPVPDLPVCNPSRPRQLQRAPEARILVERKRATHGKGLFAHLPVGHGIGEAQPGMVHRVKAGQGVGRDERFQDIAVDPLLAPHFELAHPERLGVLPCAVDENLVGKGLIQPPPAAERQKDERVAEATGAVD